MLSFLLLIALDLTKRKQRSLRAKNSFRHSESAPTVPSCTNPHILLPLTLPECSNICLQQIPPSSLTHIPMKPDQKLRLVRDNCLSRTHHLIFIQLKKIQFNIWVGLHVWAQVGWGWGSWEERLQRTFWEKGTKNGEIGGYKSIWHLWERLE